MLDDYRKRKETGSDLISYNLYIYFSTENTTFNNLFLPAEEDSIFVKFKDIKSDILTYISYERGSDGKPIRSKETEITHNALSERGLTDVDLEQFNIRVVKATQNIDEQRSHLKNKINAHFNCSSDIEIEYYYNNCFAVISDLAYKPNILDRKISKTIFFEKIDSKIFLFNKWYAALKSRDSYFNFLRKTLKRRKALDVKKHKFFFISKDFLDTETEKEKAIVRLVNNIISETYEIDKAFSTKNKVSTIVLELEDKDLELVKRELAKNNVAFNDGNEHLYFSPKKFNEAPITNTNKNDRLTKASFHIKLLSFKTFQENWNTSDIKEKVAPIEVALFFSNQPSKEFFKNITEEFETFVISKSDKFNSFTLISELFEKLIISDDYFRVVTVLPNLIQVEVTNADKFSKKNENLSLGSYIKITDENQISVIGILQSYKIRDVNTEFAEIQTVEKKEPSFMLDIQPVGYMENGIFQRGGSRITIPPNEVEVADDALLKTMFTLSEKDRDKVFSFGNLSNYLTRENKPLAVEIDGNKFFNKHIAVVGSTGAGKSCTVAKILQEGIRAEYTENQLTHGLLNNSHILIFDLHSEYKSAFPTGRYLSVKDLTLPYWLMNADELEVILLGNEFEDSHKKTVLKKAIIENKKLYYNGDKEQVTYDLPVFFDLKEIHRYLSNLNDSRRTQQGTHSPIWKLEDSDALSEDFHDSFTESDEICFAYLCKYKCLYGEGHSAKFEPYNGQFTKMLTKIDAQLKDERLDFLFKKTLEYKTEELKNIISQFVGHTYRLKGSDLDKEKSNVTIIDLSGIPFEVLNFTVALISRLVFSFCYYWKKWNDSTNTDALVKNPFLVVYEEAHNYIPKTEDAKYRSVREVVERIAKEGRKYGLSAMIVSQRPSEISETILSQCNSFVIMRITNPTDQSYIRRLLPDTLSGVTDNLSMLQPREALIIGEAIPVPTIVKVNKVDEDKLPKSVDVPFIEKWRMDWDNLTEIDEIIKSMTEK